MGSAIPIVNSSALHFESNENIDSVARIKQSYTPELIFVLCGHLGASGTTVSHLLRDILLKDFKYEECHEIRLSDFITEYKHYVAVTIEPDQRSWTSRYREIREKIDIGNALRDKFGKSILADLCIKKIASDRQIYERKRRKIENNEVLPVEELSTNTLTMQTSKIDLNTA